MDVGWQEHKKMSQIPDMPAYFFYVYDTSVLDKQEMTECSP